MLLIAITDAGGTLDPVRVAGAWKDAAPALLIALAESGSSTTELRPWVAVLGSDHRSRICSQTITATRISSLGC